jgi:hypothetical protein
VLAVTASDASFSRVAQGQQQLCAGGKTQRPEA